MRALLIVNPNATSTTAAGRDLLAHALASTVQLQVVHTTHRGHAKELAEQSIKQGYSAIIVHGGDGTVNEVVNGLLGAPTPISLGSLIIGPIPALAVVPGGSANVFARSIGMHPDPVEATNQLINLLLHRRRRHIGLGHCDGRWFTFNAGMGLDAEVVEAVEASRAAGRRATASRYIRSAVKAALANARKEPTLTVQIADQEPVSGIHFAFISNSSPWTFANKRPVVTNPATSFDSGLGVFAVSSMQLGANLRLTRQILTPGSKLQTKHLLRQDDVPIVRITSSVPIGLQLDGDYIGLRDKVTFRSVASALEVIAEP
ncbi:MAG: diacylglycerol/lipid kinase family protein [Mycobacteriaceae bacterium]